VLVPVAVRQLIGKAQSVNLRLAEPVPAGCLGGGEQPHREDHLAAKAGASLRDAGFIDVAFEPVIADVGIVRDTRRP
jgi:hypothetical protein